ncbi:MAG: ATP-binding protein [Candidatus Bathyarchaeota archaeon]|nr:ATP-binding protein [Candidatus Bathyarchaeota archaeon]MDH5788605.1 ATP-binding protein [Candidatus Bathyarchaeota archaeon]
MQELKPVYIDVAASIIADISSGIYRTPANALKELVSNSFDADATEVYVNTGYSNFDLFTVEDNGDGMPVDDFIYYMEHIGGSVKRYGSRLGFTRNGRPIIGKLGIGILAVSQICKEFTVISSNGNGKKFEATIDLSEFEEKEARKKQLAQRVDKTVRIGEFRPVLYDEEKGKKYTLITLNKINEGYRKTLQKDFNLPNLKRRLANPQGFNQFVEEIAKVKRGLEQFTEYDRLIWELSLVAPLPYLNLGPIIGQKCIPKIKKRLENYNFRVIVDGLELRKPILFPLDEKVKTKGVHFDFVSVNFDSKVGESHEESRLQFHGYIYFQYKAIIPPELRGILIRIRNVAIGYYDKSLLHYPMPAGPLSNQVSGEIYVERGLENALNIDRNSFRETDLHYLALQESIFTALAGIKMEKKKKRKMPEEELPVFDRIRLYSRRRREQEIKDNEQDYLRYLENILRQILKSHFTINVVDEEGKQPVAVVDANKIVIYDKNPLWPRRRNERKIFRKILIFKEVAENISGSVESAKSTFFQLLKRSRK